MLQFWKSAFLGLLGLSVTLVVLASDNAKKNDRNGDRLTKESRVAIQEALGELNPLIGGWKGVGQPVRGSTKGTWSETADWVWEIKKEHVGLRYSVEGGKQLASGLVTWNPDKKDFVLVAMLPDKSERIYTGARSGNKITFESGPDANNDVHQIVLTQLNEKRTLVLFQIRAKDQKQFTRVAEVGYTREGTKLAEEGIGGPECIVTGGKGTMNTVYKGKTYWFCCTGCRDAFRDDPDAIIAQAEQKAAAKKAAAEQKKKGKKEKS